MMLKALNMMFLTSYLSFLSHWVRISISIIPKKLLVFGSFLIKKTIFAQITITIS